jgi:pectate disaccharide-lyase
VDQFGPENGAKPAAQEGAGLLVRDIIGVPRQQPLKAGYEEFPAASNQVMNAIMTQDKKDHHRIKLQAITREGISHPWGNAGAEIKKQSYKEEVDLQQTPEFRLRLERTDSGFITSWAPAGSDEWVSKSVPRADLISVQDNAHYYVGFFASRNAKITVTGASLTTSPAHTLESAPWQAKALPVVVQLASGSQSTSTQYLVQARANYDGVFSVWQNEVVIGNDKPVKAGEMYTLPATLGEKNDFRLTFTPTSTENPRWQPNSAWKNSQTMQQQRSMPRLRGKPVQKAVKVRRWI